jgi:hypothetical protein
MTTLAPLKKGDWDLECGSLPSSHGWSKFIVIELEELEIM